MASYAAIDLGATSGRVAVATISNGKISHEIIHRFPNEPINDPEHGLLWNWSQLQQEVLIGLAKKGFTELNLSGPPRLNKITAVL